MEPFLHLDLPFFCAYNPRPDAGGQTCEENMEDTAEVSAPAVAEPAAEAPATDSRPVEEAKESPTEALVKEYADDPRVAPHLRRPKEEKVEAKAEEEPKEETPKKNHSERRVEKLKEEVQEALKSRAELKRELEELRRERESLVKPKEPEQKVHRTEEDDGVRLSFDAEGKPIKPNPKDFMDEAGDFDYAAHAAAMGAYGAEMAALKHKKSSETVERERFAKELDSSRDAFSKAEASYAKENPGYVEAAKKLLPLLVDGEDIDGEFIPSGKQRNEILSIDIVRRKDPRLLEYLAEQPGLVRALVRVKDPQAIIESLDDAMDDMESWAKARKKNGKGTTSHAAIPVTPSPKGQSAGADSVGAFTRTSIKGKSQSWLRENADNINKAIAAGTFFR